MPYHHPRFMSEEQRRWERLVALCRALPRASQRDGPRPG
jgi:hypothetical protein